jgi:hypothetical protein
MEYRLNKKTLLEKLGEWNSFLRRKISLIACGGTALTLLDVKASTKDVDFMVPEEADYRYLIKTLKNLGYRQITGSGWARTDDVYIFDLFAGNRIHTTELLESPLKSKNHILLKEFSRLYIGILNYYDLISSKLFRGTRVDFDDCLMLVEARHDEIDINYLIGHFKKLASYDVSEDRLSKNIDSFLLLLKEKNLHG